MKIKNCKKNNHFDRRKMISSPPAARGALFEKTAPLDPPQKLFIHSSNDPTQKINQNPRKISLLINSFYFYMDCVFVLFKEDCFQLMVIRDNHLIMEKKYNTLSGAKIGFRKLFEQYAWRKDIKAIWTPPYTPQTNWLNKKKAPEALNL